MEILIHQMTPTCGFQMDRLNSYPIYLIDRTDTIHGNINGTVYSISAYIIYFNV